MNSDCPNSRVCHDHSFGQSISRPQEKRVAVVAVVTLVVMMIEVAAGLLTGSMALLADGVHMGTHALALGLAVGAYVFTRRLADDRRFSFGTGKAGELAAFASAMLLGSSALMIVVEALARVMAPRPIAFGEALVVAVIGLVVNVVSALVLVGRDNGEAAVASVPGDSGHGQGHGQGHGASDHHDPDHGHDHDHDGHHEPEQGTTHRHGRDGDHHARAHGLFHASDHLGHGDHNLRAALLHVTADAMTSGAAIVALGAGWWLGWVLLDPLVAIVAAGVILVWAYTLAHSSGRVLLDMEAPDSVRGAVVAALEAGGDGRVTDLHLWAVGPDAFTLVAQVATHSALTPDAFKARLATIPLTGARIHHPIIEVRHCTVCSLRASKAV